MNSNPFVTLSSYNQDELMKNKKLMMRLVDQISSAYGNIKHKNVVDLKDQTRLEIGCVPNNGCVHTFTAMNGYVAYSPYVHDFNAVNGVLHDPVLKEMSKQDPKWCYYSGGRVKITIQLKDDHTLTDQLKFVVYCMEKDGFTLRR